MECEICREREAVLIGDVNACMYCALDSVKEAMVKTEVNRKDGES